MIADNRMSFAMDIRDSSDSFKAVMEHGYVSYGEVVSMLDTMCSFISQNNTAESDINNYIDMVKCEYNKSVIGMGDLIASSLFTIAMSFLNLFRMYGLFELDQRNRWRVDSLLSGHLLILYKGQNNERQCYL